MRALSKLFTLLSVTIVAACSTSSPDPTPESQEPPRPCLIITPTSNNNSNVVTGCPKHQECSADGVCRERGDRDAGDDADPPPLVVLVDASISCGPCPVGYVCGRDGLCRRETSY